jgi:PAS domain S-box-containing protein
VSPQNGFPAGDSEAARVIRTRDWSQTSLGPLDAWPSAVKSALNLMLNSPDSMYLVWGPELIFFHNDAYAPVLGPRLSRAIGSRFSELWSDVWDQVAPMVEDALAGRPYRCIDLPLTMARYGEIEHTWWSFSFCPLYDEHGEVLGMFCSTNETTRNVLDRQALQASEQKRLQLIDELMKLDRQQAAMLAQRTAELDTFWEISPDLLVMVDFKGIFLRVNPAWKAVLGRDPRELVGSSILDLVHPDDRTSTQRALDHATGQVLPLFENRYLHIDGTYRWIGWTAAPGSGLIFGLGKHMTYEKQRSEALRAAEEALRQSQKMEAVGQLTGGLAHDFNNLLMGVSGNIELLQARVNQGRFEELGRYIGAALEGSRRAASLTHRLLAFSRRQTLAPKPTDVDQLVRGMEELIRGTVGPAIEMRVNGTPGLWSTMVDPHQLENALLNLCINARDAMPDGGRLRIETSNLRLEAHAARKLELEPGRYVALSVGDTGTGMSPEVVSRAFDPFFTTKPIGMGTGLGLSMIYGFARQSGGGVQIISSVGRGSEVRIFLPMLEETVGDREEDDADEPLIAKAAGGETVLVVDDEPAVRSLMAEVLVELGCHVLQAEHGAAALVILESNAPIDLMISDVGLPGGVNGRQLADAARVLRPELNVLFVTGYAEKAALGDGVLEPGMHVLPKPFSIAALNARVTELLDGAA